MSHANGWCTPWAVTGIGGTHVCLREVRGEVIWDLIREHRVTHLNGAPTVVTTIMNAPEAGRLDYSLLITTAGAPPSPTTILQMEQMGFRIVHVYGLTETYGPYSVCQSQPGWPSLEPQERATLQSRQGVSMIQAERLRVVDETMKDVPNDGLTMGEILLRGNSVMAGYYRPGIRPRLGRRSKQPGPFRVEPGLVDGDQPRRQDHKRQRGAVHQSR